MIDRTYRCDLCRDMHDPNAQQLVGIYWGGHPETIYAKPVRDVERHLCVTCIKQIVAMFQTLQLPDSAGAESK